MSASRRRARSRASGSAGKFVHEDAEQDVAMRCRIVLREGSRDQVLKKRFRAAERVGRTLFWVEQVKGALHDDTLPVEEIPHLVRLECAPWVMQHCRELRAGAGAPE